MTYTKKDIFQQLTQARRAHHDVARLSCNERNAVLNAIQKEIRARQESILKANRGDVKRMAHGDPKIDRLILDEKRILGMLADMREIIKQPDPLGIILEKKTLHNGLKLKKVSVPLGVIGVIYESRPNVTLDVVALAIKSGNVAVLKGGEEAGETNRAIVACIHTALRLKGIPSDAVMSFGSAPRSSVTHLLKAVGMIDVIIPRGGRGLIDFVRKEAVVPIIETGAGVCHVYIDETADILKAVKIVANAKLTRPSVCNSLDTIVIHKKVAQKIIPLIAQEFKHEEVVIHADTAGYTILKKSEYPFVRKAHRATWSTEWLSFQCGLKIVNSADEALAHISHYSTRHSEAIMTENKKTAHRFLQEVDAAVVYHNASTRFTDGSCFEMGGEIGISTQKLHARGPMGLKELTTYKWIVSGNGQIRE